MTYTLSQDGARFIARFEGVRLNLYNDPANKCTIGIGHLVHDGPCDGSEPEEFKRGLTEEQAWELLTKDVQGCVDCIQQLVKVPLNQNQVDALTSFTYNLGCGNLMESDLLKRLNAGDYAAVPQEMMRWVYAGSNVLPGLVARRRAEGQLFMGSEVDHETLCTVTADQLHIRAQPTSQSALIATYPRGTTLNFIEVVNGENVDGNPRWGHSEQGHYFWLGGTDHPDGKSDDVPGDDYPYRNSPPDAQGGDPWGFFYRECTSFVAWRMNHQYVIPFTNGMRGGHFGNADTWADNARALGYRVDNTPSVGAIAQWGSNVNEAGPGGHVALVAQVNPNGTVTVEQYNWAPQIYAYSTMTIPANFPSCYLHIAH